MKTTLLLLAVAAAAFSSCSTMYKTGQTPDDVYYSPARPYAEGVVEEKQQVQNTRPQRYDYSMENRQIRMGIMDSRWRYLDLDYGYNYSPYNYSMYNTGGFYSGNTFNNSFYNPYYSHGYYNNYASSYYYNPYYSPYPVYLTPASPIKTSTPRMTNLSGYGTSYNNANGQVRSVVPTRNYNNSNDNSGRTSGLGNVLNKVLAPTNTNSNNNNNAANNNNNNTRVERTYTPPPPASSSSSSSGGSSSGGGGTRISRPN